MREEEEDGRKGKERAREIIPVVVYPLSDRAKCRAAGVGS